MPFRSTSSLTPALRAAVTVVLPRTRRAGRHARQSAFTAGTVVAACGLALAMTAGALTVGATSGGEASASDAKPAAKITAHVSSPTAASTTSVAATTASAAIASGLPVVTGALDVAQGPVTGGTTVTLTGDNLDKVTRASVGTQAATVVATTETSVTLAMPAAPNYSEGKAPVLLYDDEVQVPVADAATDATDGAPLSFTYATDQVALANQVNYVLAYWNTTNPDFVRLRGVDCANFASQGLLARGWTMDAGWWYNAGASSPAWISSTALRDYLAAHPERAVPLGADRSTVKIGDIAQFDWDNSGDVDHTATVTRVDRTPDGVKVYVSSHTKDVDFWDVDVALATGGGSVAFWSIH